MAHDGDARECWEDCGEKGGACPGHCGINGYCCSGDPNKSDSNGNCNSDQLAEVTKFWLKNPNKNNHHTCVVPPGGLVRTLITDENLHLIKNKETIFIAGGLVLLDIGRMSDWLDFIDPSAKELLSNPNFDGNIIEVDWAGGSSSWRTFATEFFRDFREKGRIPAALRLTVLTKEHDDPLTNLFLNYFNKFVYAHPVSNSRGAGRMVAYFIKKLVQHSGLSPSNINLVGLSLGGQMIGYAGKSWNVIKLRVYNIWLHSIRFLKHITCCLS